jgi:predicted MFS family arabinose efflux permease
LADLKSVQLPDIFSGVIGTEVSGWRLPFYIFGAIGVIWAICLAIFMKDAKQGEQGDKASFTDALKAVCTRPSALLLAVVFGLLVYVDVGFKTWMPTFMAENFFDGKLTSANSNFVGWVYAGSFVGVLVGSRICDKLFKKIKNIRFSLNLVGFALLTPFLLLSANTEILATCKIALLCYGFFKGICDSCMFASILDVVPTRYRASGMGIMICGGFFIGSTSSTVLGLIRDTAGLTTGISSLGIFSLLNVVVLLVIIKFFFKKDYVG